MNTLTKPGDNLGGLLKIWAVPKAVYSRSGTTVTISDDTDVYALYCTPESMQFSEPQVETPGGIYYNTSVSGFIPGDTEAALAAINNMADKKYVVIFQDGNGNYKAAGTGFYPLKLKATLNSGKNVADLAGWEISFAGETIHRAVKVDNPF